MTNEYDDPTLVKKIVLVVDICSSSQIIEDLIKTSSVKIWRDALIAMKEHLVVEAPQNNAEIYKFIGDGWIVLFPKPYSQSDVMLLIISLNEMFDKHYKEKVFPFLDSPPSVSGLTFGVDEGQLIKVTMQEKTEYVGRPINIASRLQAAISQVDIKSGYNVFMSHRLFNSLGCSESLKEVSEATERSLKNVSDGGMFRLYRISISDSEFRIISATYGTPDNSIDVTFQYTKQVHNDKLDVVVSNTLAENDPHPGESKTLRIVYKQRTTEHERTFPEGARIQLP